MFLSILYLIIQKIQKKNTFLIFYLSNKSPDNGHLIAFIIFLSSFWISELPIKVNLSFDIKSFFIYSSKDFLSKTISWIFSRADFEIKYPLLIFYSAWIYEFFFASSFYLSVNSSFLNGIHIGGSTSFIIFPVILHFIIV